LRPLNVKTPALQANIHAGYRHGILNDLKNIYNIFTNSPLG
jgi:hypothetical protein